MAKYRRRRYFIDHKFQLKYIVLTILLLLLYTMIFVAILFTPYVVPLYFDYPLDKQVEAARTLLSLHKSIWPALGVVILSMGALSIFITHKVAGPVYRFKKVLAEVFEGNLNVSIRLRKRDDLKDLAEDLNTMIKQFQVFVETMKWDREIMSKCITEIENQRENKNISSETATELIRKMQLNKDNLSQFLDKYST